RHEQQPQPVPRNRRNLHRRVVGGHGAGAGAAHDLGRLDWSLRAGQEAPPGSPCGGGGAIRLALHKLLSRFQPPWRALLALLVGALSGVLAQAVGLPLPWMLGPMIGTTIVALSGAPIRSPARLRVVFLPVLGVMLGSGIDASILL